MNMLSFFSGAMGLDIGLEKAGFEVCLASEVNKDAVKTIKKNIPGLPVIDDIRDFTSNDILSISGFRSGEDIDVIVGGPPCQAFSTAGKRLGFNDERGNVFLHFIDLACQLRPKYLVIENVRGLLSAPLKHLPHIERKKNGSSLSEEEKPGGVLKKILNILNNNGYSVSFNLYNSACFGTPQVRERVILICSREKKNIPYIEPTHSQFKEYGLPGFNIFRDAVKGIDKNDYIEFPEKRKKYYRLLKPGENWKSLPLEIQKEALGKSFFSGGGKTGFLRRIAWDKPSPTLVTHPAMPATDLAHPEELRPLSVQEYKRLQEFPDNWNIEGNLLSQYSQLGNAVPVGLGKAIGEHIKKVEYNPDKITVYNQFKYSRYIGCDHLSWLEKHYSFQIQKKLGI